MSDPEVAKREEAQKGVQQSHAIAKSQPTTLTQKAQALFIRSVYVGEKEKKSVTDVVKETGLTKHEVIQLHKEGKLTQSFFDEVVQQNQH